MKKYLLLLFAFSAFTVISCEDDDHDDRSDATYWLLINSRRTPFTLFVWNAVHRAVFQNGLRMGCEHISHDVAVCVHCCCVVAAVTNHVKCGPQCGKAGLNIQAGGCSGCGKAAAVATAVEHAE